MLYHYKTYNLDQCAEVLRKLLQLRENLLVPEKIGLSNVGLRTYLDCALADQDDVVCNLQLMDIVSVIQSLKNSRKIWNKDEYAWGIYHLFYDLDYQSELTKILPKSYFLTEIISSGNQRLINHFNYNYAVRLGTMFNQYQFYRSPLMLDWLNNDLRKTPPEFHWQAHLYNLVVRYLQHIAPNSRHLSELLMDGKNRDIVATQTLYFVVDRVQPDWFYHQLKLAKDLFNIHLVSIQPTYYLHAYSEDLDFFSDTIYTIAGKYNQQHLLQMEKINEGTEINQTAPDNQADTNLARVQKNLLSADLEPMQLLQTEDLNCKEDCNSLQWLQCQTKLSEIMSVRDWILSKVAHDPSLSAEDFLVVSDSIEDYQSIIESIFVDNSDRTKRMPISIHTNSEPESMASAVIISLIDNPSSEQELSLLHKLVLFPSLLRNFGIKVDAWEAILGFLAKQPYQKGLFNDSDPAKETLQSVLNHLIESYLTVAEIPSDMLNVDISHLLIVQNICAFLCDFNDTIDKPMHAVGWLEALRKLHKNTVSELSFDDGSIDPFDKIFKLLQTLATVTADSLLDRKSIAVALQGATKSFQQSNVKPKGSIIFSDLDNARLLTRKHTCFIGMQHNNKVEQITDFNDLIQKYPQPSDYDRFDSKMYSIMTCIMNTEQSILFTMVDLDATQQQFNHIVNYLLVKTKQNLVINKFVLGQRDYHHLDFVPHTHKKWLFEDQQPTAQKPKNSLIEVTQSISVNEIVNTLYGSLYMPNTLLLNYFLGSELLPKNSEIKSTDEELNALQVWKLRKLAFDFLNVKQLFGGEKHNSATQSSVIESFIQFAVARGKLDNSVYSRVKLSQSISDLSETDIQSGLFTSRMLEIKLPSNGFSPDAIAASQKDAITVGDIVFSSKEYCIQQAFPSMTCNLKNYAKHWVEHLLYNAVWSDSQTDVFYLKTSVHFAGMPSDIALYYLTKLVSLVVAVRSGNLLSGSVINRLLDNYKIISADDLDVQNLRTIDANIQGEPAKMVSRLNLSGRFEDASIPLSKISWKNDASAILDGYLIPVAFYSQANEGDK